MGLDSNLYQVAFSPFFGRMRHMTIAVVIPAYNEAGRIGAVLKALPTHLGDHKVVSIVVDDGSRDTTSEVARAFSDVRVFRHGTNMGKGAAAKTGCDAAVRLGAEIIVLMDADGQHRAEDLERIVEPLLHSEKALVIGVRQRGGDRRAADVAARHPRVRGRSPSAGGDGDVRS